MKTLLTLVFVLTATITSVAQQNQQNHQHKQHLDTLMAEYMQAKNALASDDYKSARKHLQAFAGEVKGSEEMKHHPKHTEQHAKHHTAMVTAVDETMAAENLEELRAGFKKVSEELIKAVKNQGYEAGLYKQHCPMYQGGSSWLSSSEEIRNPYFGSRMLKCGSVVEEL